MKNILFICSRNKLRSPTAEHLFSNHEGIKVRSAGLSKDAETPLESEDVVWADVIMVMEQKHKKKLLTDFRGYIKNQKVICLGIPDDYEYMDDKLVEILTRKVSPLIN